MRELKLLVRVNPSLFQQKQFDKSLMALFPSKFSTDPMAAWDRIRRLIGVGTLRILITSERYVGLGPEASQVRNVACILLDGRIPYLLRRSIDRSHLMVGGCCINGLMHGEALNCVEEWNFQK